MGRTGKTRVRFTGRGIESKLEKRERAEYMETIRLLIVN